MAVSFDAKPTAYNSADGLNQQASGVTSITATTGYTVGASATLLVAMMVIQGTGDGIAPTGIAMTWNGVSMVSRAVATHASGVRETVCIFTLTNPATGNHNLVGSWTNAKDCYMSAVSFTGTDTTTGVATVDTVTGTGASQNVTVTITSTTDGATVAVAGINGDSPTVNFNKIWAEAPFNPGGGGSYQIGGTSNAHTITFTAGSEAAWAGVHVIAAAGGGLVIPVAMHQYAMQRNA